LIIPESAGKSFILSAANHVAFSAAKRLQAGLIKITGSKAIIEDLFNLISNLPQLIFSFEEL
jgi:hypothetical protein